MLILVAVRYTAQVMIAHLTFERGRPVTFAMTTAKPRGRAIARPVLVRCVVLLAAFSFDLAGQSSGPQPDIDSIRGLIAEYAHAVDTAGVELVRQIWSNSPEVSFIHPLGHEHGIDQISQNVFQHLMGETFSERKLSVKDVSIHVYGDSAWSEFYWDFAAKLRKGGAPVATKGRETQVYHKERGHWRLVHVHYSGMPLGGGRSGTN
jgi:ketosteroid isomerase-like protein